MSDLICRKTMQRCQTPGMCSPHGGCSDSSAVNPGAPLPGAILAADHDRIVSGLQAQVEQLTAERARWVENAEALGGKCDQLEERCRELEEEARAPLCFCGLPMAKNPHPDAGKPDKLLKVGAVYVCIPCLNKANHDHAKSANALRAEVERLRKDAERYRWARRPESGNVLFTLVGAGECGPNMDSAIDAALEASR